MRGKLGTREHVGTIARRLVNRDDRTAIMKGKHVTTVLIDVGGNWDGSFYIGILSGMGFELL